MNIQVEGNTLFLIPERDLVASNYETLRETIWQNINDNHELLHVVLDARGIDIVDSLGVNLIIGLYRHLISEAKTFEVTNAGPNFVKVANFFRFSTLFNIKEMDEGLSG